MPPQAFEFVAAASLAWRAQRCTLDRETPRSEGNFFGHFTLSQLPHDRVTVNQAVHCRMMDTLDWSAQSTLRSDASPHRDEDIPRTRRLVADAVGTGRLPRGSGVLPATDRRGRRREHTHHSRARLGRWE